MAGTTKGQDFATVLSTVAGMEAIKFAFGWQVAIAVAITTLICCVVFLYHVGASLTRSDTKGEGDD